MIRAVIELIDEAKQLSVQTGVRVRRGSQQLGKRLPQKHQRCFPRSGERRPSRWQHWRCLLLLHPQHRLSTQGHSLLAGGGQPRALAPALSAAKWPAATQGGGSALVWHLQRSSHCSQANSLRLVKQRFIKHNWCVLISSSESPVTVCMHIFLFHLLLCDLPSIPQFPLIGQLAHAWACTANNNREAFDTFSLVKICGTNVWRGDVCSVMSRSQRIKGGTAAAEGKLKF